MYYDLLQIMLAALHESMVSNGVIIYILKYALVKIRAAQHKEA